MDVVSYVAILVCALIVGAPTLIAVLPQRVRKAKRYAVTLRNNEGAFLGLCVEKRRGTWTFEDVRIAPLNAGAAYQAAAPGRLYVPTSNILYYQEITEVANVPQ